MRLESLDGFGACPPKAMPASAASVQATTAQPSAPSEPVAFEPIRFLQEQVAEPITETLTEQKNTLQASVATKATEQKIMWGLGLTAFALFIASALKPKKQSLSGPTDGARRRLSVVQL